MHYYTINLDVYSQVKIKTQFFIAPNSVGTLQRTCGNLSAFKPIFKAQARLQSTALISSRTSLIKASLVNFQARLISNAK